MEKRVIIATLVEKGVEMSGTQRSPGRKVLFIDPPSVIEDQMIQFLITAQYEAAVVKDVEKIRPLLRKYPDSILYFNLDSRTGKSTQESIMTELLSAQEQHNYVVGILSYDKNEELAEKYLMEMGATGGYITLDLGFKKSAQILMRVLDAAEAKGSRKFVRVTVPNGKGELNIETGTDKYQGDIIDISIAGMACSFNGSFSKGSYLKSIQLRLWGQLVTLSGTVAGSRETSSGPVWVVMFDQNLDPETRSKINSFLKRVMQYEVESAA